MGKITGDDYIKLKDLITGSFTYTQNEEITNLENPPKSWLFDFKKVCLRGDFLQIWTKHFWEEMAPASNFQVGGLEVGAIPLITAITLEGHRRGRDVNGFFVRKSRKKSGLMDQLEGTLNSNPIILVDDMVNSGGSFAKQIAIIEAERQKLTERKIGEVMMLCTVITFRERVCYEYLTGQDIIMKTILTLDDFKHLGLATMGPVSDNPKKNIGVQVIWKHRANNPIYSPIIPKAELLVLEKNLVFTTDEGFVRCLSKDTGELNWQYQIVLGRKKRDLFSTPVYCAGQIIFGGRDSNLYAISAETGRRSWVCYEADWIQGSPATSPELNLVFAPLSFGLFKRQGKVVALDVITGEIKWEYGIPAPLRGGISYETKCQLIIFGADDGTVYALDARTGSLRWQQTAPFLSVSFPTISYPTNTVFLTGTPLDIKSGIGHLLALDLKTGTLKFTFKDFQFGSFSTPLLFANKLYFAALDKQIYALDAVTGQLLWQRDLEARCFASPALVKINDAWAICIGANNGRLSFFEPDQGIPLGVINLTERLLNKSVYDSEINNLFVVTQANELLAIKLT